MAKQLETLAVLGVGTMGTGMAQSYGSRRSSSGYYGGQGYGDYGDEGFIFQALAPIPVLDGNRPVCGFMYTHTYPSCSSHG